MTFQPAGSLGKRHAGVLPVIPDKGSQLSQTRDPRFATSCDAAEHLPDKDPSLDPQLVKTAVAPIKLSHTIS